MIQQEQLLFNSDISGTTRMISFFGLSSPDLSGLTTGNLLVDAGNTPIKIVEDDFELTYKRLNDNTFVFDQSIQYLTGVTTAQTLNFQLTDTQKGTIRQNFISTNQNIYGQQYKFWVDFHDTSLNDTYINILLPHTFNTLDTLTINNSVEGIELYQESKTGILFGKLEANQKINDEFGNRIKIPLKGVPITIFNSTAEFPNVSSVDSDGNRIVLNIDENSPENKYFNQETYDFGQGFLTSTSMFKTVPDKYKYSALTNEKGEFIIYDIPVGNAVLMVEVDLLKQNMTKDEVALNFFPYPTTDNPNISSVPHYYFQQFSLNVVPSYSDFQSGYTQVNISIPVDMRKWTTYIFPPVAFAQDENLETTVSKDSSNTLKIYIRDMTAPFNLYPRTLTLAQIPKDLDRDTGSQYIWYNENAERRHQVEYDTFGCYILKLPANLYDPNGHPTDKNGVPLTDKTGVWLTSYQFKEFIQETIASRETGGYLYWNNGIQHLLSHFSLTNFAGNDTASPQPTFTGATGPFPYEKPWSINYPTPYSIPSKPINQRFTDAGGRQQFAPFYYYMEEPTYEDGDLIGANYSYDYSLQIPAGGIGVQSVPVGNTSNGVFFINRIAQVATNSWMYKYEKNIAWNSTYMNGYESYWTTPDQNHPFAGISNVVNGELYQRIECGYGYFMKPQGWPRIVRDSFGNDIPSADILYQPNSYSIAPVPHITPIGIVDNMYSNKQWINDTYNLKQQNLALSLGNQTIIKNGTIDIYRIIESGTNNIGVPAPFVIPTFISFNVDASNLAESWSLMNNGEIPVNIYNKFGGIVYYLDNNNTIQLVNNLDTFKLYPGKSMFLNIYNPLSTLSMEEQHAGNPNQIALTINGLPGNSTFDSVAHIYTKANYIFTVTYPSDRMYQNQPNTSSFNLIETSSNINIPSFWVKTQTTGGANGKIVNGIDCGNDDQVWSILYESSSGSRNL
jgi:hypothetical protein